MFQFVLRKRKLMAAAVSAAMVATAFQPGGCTFNIDPGLLQALQGVGSNVMNGPGGPDDFNGPRMRPPRHPAPGDFGDDQGGPGGPNGPGPYQPQYPPQYPPQNPPPGDVGGNQDN